MFNRRKIEQLEAQVQALKAEVQALLPYKERWERTLANKKDLHARRRRLFDFFGYKSYYGIKPRFWPDVLCCDCKNAIPDGRAGVHKKTKTPKAQKWKCKIIGTRVGKFSSCNQAEKKF